MEYLGHTVNFKTHVKSYKVKKKIDNAPSQWKIFRDTHEPIIVQESFDIVQKIRQGKRRPTKMGEMPMFSGFLCADCGSKMSFHLEADQPAEKHNYVYSNYRGNTKSCTMHYIRNVVVEQIVLDNLREMIGYVSQYEDEFIRIAMDTDVRQRNKKMTKQKKRMSEIQSHMKELDNLFQRIYEDNIGGKLSDERFMKLSKGYDTEQADLQAEKHSVNVDRFLSIVKKYTNLTELTSEILHEFVDRIIVHAPTKAADGVYRKSRLSTITSEHSTIQRSLYGKENRYNTQNAIPQILT